MSAMTSHSDFLKFLHNLRNQLNNISINAELAKMELTAESNPAFQECSSTPVVECLDTILDACTKCAAIADKLTLEPVANATGAPD